MEHTHSTHRDSVIPEKDPADPTAVNSSVCIACRSYTHPGATIESHSPDCPHLPCDSARYYLAVYYKSHQERWARQSAADQAHTHNNKRIILERDAAEGKWRRLKEENNALRSQNYKLNTNIQELRAQLNSLQLAIQMIEITDPPRSQQAPALTPHHYIQDMVTTSEE